MLLVQVVFLCEPAKCTCLHLLPTSVFTTHQLADFLFFFFNHNILFLLFNSLQSVDRIRSKVKSRFISLSHTHTYAPLPPKYTYIQNTNAKSLLLWANRSDLAVQLIDLVPCRVQHGLHFANIALLAPVENGFLLVTELLISRLHRADKDPHSTFLVAFLALIVITNIITCLKISPSS